MKTYKQLIDFCGTKKTYKQLKDFCETKNVRHEVNTIYSEPWYNPYDNEEHRTILGFEIGMCNIAGRKGNSEWQWVWFETLLCPDTLEDDTLFIFRNRYSQVTGQDHRGLREGLQANRTIETRMRNV